MLDPKLAAGSSDQDAETAVPFVKMHGLGNDYIYIDERQTRIDSPSRWARILSDRHRGIGGDGVILLRRDREFPCRMEMYNADGSRAEMCGNGIRCVAVLAWERGYSPSPAFAIGTDAGARAVEVLPPFRPPHRVRVSMGIPHFEAEVETVDAGGRTFRGSILSVGNPHFVIPLEEPPAEFPVERFGPLLESHSRFPKRTNVEFVRARNAREIEFRVWERGSGETRACGTGATAAVAALHRRGLIASKVAVHLLGGDLEIEIGDRGEAFMTGPAEEAYRGTFARSVVREQAGT
ncbi:MAG: diaminopimelate epimerase [Planctomycetes bacterium]|nr:diaminopimelate epimerase [Planctomycetota bacterium]